jgi:hypothetical protein
MPDKRRPKNGTKIWSRLRAHRRKLGSPDPILTSSKDPAAWSVALTSTAARGEGAPEAFLAPREKAQTPNETASNAKRLALIGSIRQSMRIVSPW